MARRGAPKGLMRRLARLWDFLLHKQEGKAFLVVVILSAITIAASKLWPGLQAAVAARLGLSEQGFYLALLAAGVVSLLAYIGFNWSEIFSSDQGLRGIARKPERLRIVPIETEAQLREVQEGVVAEVFQSYTPPDEEVYRIFRKNPRRSIGLYSDDAGAFVGFASIWPVTPQAAAALKTGTRVEEDLTADDILPVAENRVAGHAVVPGIAVLPNARGDTTERGARLIRAFGDFIGREYLKDPGRRIELIASAFGEDGLGLCTRFEMLPLGSFVHAPGSARGWFRKAKRMPLFAKQVTLADLRRHKRQL